MSSPPDPSRCGPAPPSGSRRWSRSGSSSNGAPATRPGNHRPVPIQRHRALRQRHRHPIHRQPPRSLPRQRLRLHLRPQGRRLPRLQPRLRRPPRRPLVLVHHRLNPSRNAPRTENPPTPKFFHPLFPAISTPSPRALRARRAPGATPPRYREARTITRPLIQTAHPAPALLRPLPTRLSCMEHLRSCASKCIPMHPFSHFPSPSSHPLPHAPGKIEPTAPQSATSQPRARKNRTQTPPPLALFLGVLASWRSSPPRPTRRTSERHGAAPRACPAKSE